MSAVIKSSVLRGNHARRGPKLKSTLAVLFALTSSLILCPSDLFATDTVEADRKSDLPISFELDIQPILTKAGCNAGACHGKQRGQNGFQLSLLAFDSDFDFAAITQDARGRRIFPAAPSESLLLLKAVAKLPHGGGKRFEIASDDYQLLLRWIEQGAERSVAGEPSIEKVELAKTDFSIAPGGTSQLSVLATYSDGSTRDVTAKTGYLSNETPVASVSETGLIQAGELPGETAIMARYMNHIAVADVIIPRPGHLDLASYEDLPVHNFIDLQIYNKLKRASVLPSGQADESVVLRRLYTDIIGRFPTVEETRAYLASKEEDKRQTLINELLDRPEYVDHWANQWADLLRPNPYRVGIKAVLNYDNWIRQQFREGVRYDEFARRLITAKGSTWKNGAVTLFRDRRTPDEMATLVSQLFLGVRLECAKCHHHPFEKWSQRDFYQFAAFFSNVRHKGTGLSPPISGGEETVFVSTGRPVRHPITDESLSPNPLFGKLASDGSGSQKILDPREQLVEWMVGDGKEYFAKVQVNRIWAQLMGRGLVEPIDDIRLTNPPTNPELFNALAKEFINSDYDQKHMIRLIANSATYSLSSKPNETNVGDRINYSRHYRHRFRAEVLLDSLDEIIEVDNKMRGMPGGSRSNQIWTHRVSSMFLDTFGRPDPNQDPPCERTSDSTVAQSLHLMNSRELEFKLQLDDSRANRLAKSDMPEQEIAKELYLAVFSRLPSESESRYVVELLTKAKATQNGEPDKETRQVIQDLLWALINAPECSIQN